MMGVALRRAASRISSPGRRAVASARASASRKIASARLRLPLCMILEVKREVTRLATAGSTYLSLRSGWARRGMSGGLFGDLRAVLRAALATVAHAGRVERAADDVVLHGG